MAPPCFLDPEKVKVDGLAFLGLSLARKSIRGHPGSCTHQTALDLDQLTDRDYEYVLSTSDDGWLVGGGEPPHSYKLTAPDSAHVELMHLGTFDPALGGIAQDELLQAFVEAKILIPEITVVPTSVVVTNHGSNGVVLQLRFDMESAYHHETESHGCDMPPLPVNWQLRFLHNQLFRHFHFPSRYCYDPFSCRMADAVEFRSDVARAAYRRHCDAVVSNWRNIGPKPLAPPLTRNIIRIKSPTKHVRGGTVGSSDQYTSGLWLFRDRHTPTHLVEPNFLPPYDTPAKRNIIFNVLSEEWDPNKRMWKPAPPLPKPDLISNRAVADTSISSGWACGAFTSALCASGK